MNHRRSAAFAIVALVVGLIGSPADAASQVPDDFATRSCSIIHISSWQEAEACTSVFWATQDHTGIGAGLDITAYKHVRTPCHHWRWVEDDSVQVSADSASLYVDGSKVGGVGYPSGPQPGHASSGVRGVISVSGGESVSSSGTAGVWMNGQEVKAIAVQSRTATVPAT